MVKSLNLRLLITYYFSRVTHNFSEKIELSQNSELNYSLNLHHITPSVPRSVDSGTSYQSGDTINFINIIINKTDKNLSHGKMKNKLYN